MDDYVATLLGLGAIAAAALLVAARYLLRRPQAAGAAASDSSPAEVVDPRERRVHDCAQAVRQILLRLMDAISGWESAAGENSASLEEARQQLEAMVLTADLQEAQAMIVGQVKRLIAANAQLQEDLQKARASLEEQQRHIEALKTAVRTDDLTGLPNRTHFWEHLQVAYERYRRFQETFSVLLLDLDRFKAINDSRGHAAGDRVLKGVASRLRASLRGVDFLARYGGEEFAALLPRTREREAVLLAERVRGDLETSAFVLDGETLRVTVSVGAAEAQPAEAPEHLLNRADQALYRAKNEGRNRVCAASAIYPPAQEGKPLPRGAAR
ncbi:MAG: diguanylate cyclase [Planctomycetota bacterium]|nr:diguanylate cyclase [Planctomycetota bacterium]